ncbi:MAG: hypothetical protein LUQ24_06710, partial [Methanobacterium sp.]|nr:hypothetical protein [Methanobacterium sp.]
MTILGGMLESFKILGDTKISLLSENPEIDKLRYEPEVKVIDVKKYLILKRTFKQRNLLIKAVDSLPVLSWHILYLIFFKILGK